MLCAEVPNEGAAFGGAPVGPTDGRPMRPADDGRDCLPLLLAFDSVIASAMLRSFTGSAVNGGGGVLEISRVVSSGVAAAEPAESNRVIPAQGRGGISTEIRRSSV